MDSSSAIAESEKNIQWPPKRTNFHRCLVMMVHLVMASDDKAQPSECIQGGGHRLPVGWGGLERFFTSHHIAVKFVSGALQEQTSFLESNLIAYISDWSTNFIIKLITAHGYVIGLFNFLFKNRWLITHVAARTVSSRSTSALRACNDA